MSPTARGTLPAFPRAMRRASLSLFLALCAPAIASAQDTPAPSADPVPVPVPVPAAEPVPVPVPLPVPAAEPVPVPVPVPVPSPSPLTAAATAGTLDRSLAEQSATDVGFGFGSYGRVSAGSDMRGARATPINVVAHGSRIIEPTYLELDVYYKMRPRKDLGLSIVTTLAFGDVLFHDTGDFDARSAIRNLYLEAVRELPAGTGSVWVGSRMYRGDDIYLLDYWPLDDSNTLGAGAGYRLDRLEAGAHIGWNRLNDPFQFQERDVFQPGDGVATIPELDRQRWIASAKASYRVLGDGTGLSAKAKLYGEVTGLPEGQRRRQDDTIEELPDDRGFAVGGQLGLWGFAERQSHLNLFLRYGKGLSAYDELAVPEDLAADRRTYPGASEVVMGVSGNLDLPYGGAQLGGYLRRFTDADPATSDQDDGWEYIVAARPRARIVQDLEGGVDLSWQVRFPRGIDPVELTAMDPAVFQVAPMLLYSPFGPGGYARPQLRLVYRAAHLNEAARSALYPLDDPRRERTWAHFLGVQAEWWFNSTYR
jgi:hypothetical protein